GVTLLVAGKVATPYFTHNPGVAERIPGASRLLPTLSAAAVAHAIRDAILHRRPLVFAPRALALFCSPLAPIPAISAWLLRATGSSVGKIEPDGTLRKEGSSIGKIESGGTIRKNGSSWGSASNCCGDHGSKRTVAAVLVFFDRDYF